MNDMYEILFDNVEVSKIKSVLADLSANGSKIKSVTFSQMEGKDYSSKLKEFSFIEDFFR